MPVRPAKSGGLRLQRKCACGSPASLLTGECSECGIAKRLPSQLSIGAPSVPFAQVSHLPVGDVMPQSMAMDFTPKSDKLGATAAGPAVGVRTTLAKRLPLSQTSVLGLQRKCACGSGATSGHCEECNRKRELGLQTKLVINAPGDTYEEEADRVATSMMGSSTHPVITPRPVDGEFRHPTDSDLVRGGDALPRDVAGFYEASFGRDFSGVRVHTGETAARYNEAVNAYAFTYGNHIWLGSSLRPRTSHILAHELAHVVQQTQPPLLADASGQQNLSSSHRSVQRFLPYWMPSEWFSKGKGVGDESHKLILPVIGKHNSIYTEAPVPNADRNGEGFNKQGRADLYEATTTVGLFFAAAKMPKKLGAHRDLKYKGEPLEPYGHIKNSAPQAVEDRRGVIRGANAPTIVRVGDLKPSHGTLEAEEGPEQVQGYLRGFERARNEVNEMAVGGVGEGGLQQTDSRWRARNPMTGLIEITIPRDFQEPVAYQDARNLILMHNGSPVPVRRQVKGKVHVRAGEKGIWNYIWAPTTRLTPEDLPESVTTFGTEVTQKIIRPLLVSPVGGAGKSRPARASASLVHAPRRIQATPRGTAAATVKDPFDKAQLQVWESDHARLTGEEKKLEKTSEFEEAEFNTLVLKDREAGVKSGFNLDKISGPLSPRAKEAAKTLDKIRFWTGASSKVFGKMRYFFGGAFVKVANAYHAIRARFQALLDKKPSPKSSGLTGTVLRIAFDVLKIAGRMIVQRTTQHLANSLTKGVEQKLKDLIPEDRVEDFNAKIEEIRELADSLEKAVVETVEGLVERTIGPYAKHIEAVADVASKLSTANKIIKAVRTGARILACLSPPGWGCLWILAESVIEKFASWLIDRCWFKREIAPLITEIDFIAQLPKDLASLIIDKIRGFLPTPVQGVFATIDASAISTTLAPTEICDKDDRYPRDRALLEKLALDELRKEIGEAKWAAWIKLGELYGINRGKSLTEQQIIQLKKALQKADLAALKEAADLYGAFSPSTEVTNLTTFLEQAQEFKESLSGGGGGGRGGAGDGPGGAGGVRVPVSDKPVVAQYSPVKSKFEVVGGVTRRHYRGDVIKVDVAASIKGTIVTLEGVEVRVEKRLFTPNERNPERIEVHLEVTKEQYFEIEKKLGAEIVRKIGYKSFRFHDKAKLVYTLQLKGQVK